METLINRIDSCCHLNEDEKTMFYRNLRVLHFPKDTVVIGEGKIDDSLYFLLDGVWRASKEDDGEETTFWFAIPGEFVISTRSYYKGEPSHWSVVSASNSRAVEMKKDVIKRLAQSSPAFTEWLQEVYLKMLLDTENWLIDISPLKAEKRYLLFMKKMPEILNSVSLKDVAGYLGIKPQSLSRIRASFNKKK